MSSPEEKEETSESLQESRVTHDADSSTELNARPKSEPHYEESSTAPESAGQTRLYNMDSINHPMSSPYKLASPSRQSLNTQNVAEPLQRQNGSDFRAGATNQDSRNMPWQQTCPPGPTSRTQQSSHGFGNQQFPVEQRTCGDISSRHWDSAGRQDPPPSSFEYQNSNSKEASDYHANGKSAEMMPNVQWMPPMYDHGVPVGPNVNPSYGYPMRVPYYNSYYPFQAPSYPHGGFPPYCPPNSYFPDGVAPSRGVLPYVGPPQYMPEGMPRGPAVPYMEAPLPRMVARYPNCPLPSPYMDLTRHRMGGAPPPPYVPPPYIPGGYHNYQPQPTRTNKGNGVKQQVTNKPRNPNMTSLYVDGRELNYNWPPPQGSCKASQDVRSTPSASEASVYGKGPTGDHRQKQMFSPALSSACDLVAPPSNGSVRARTASEASGAGAPSTDTSDYFQSAEFATNEDGLLSTERRMEQIHGMCSNSVTDAENTQRRSKNTTKPLAKATFDMLQEAMKEKPDKAVKIAKTLFSKRMLTLYGWLYPATAKREIKLSIDKLWDRLPLSEKEFYLSQAEGRFGSRSTGVMVNPQLAALPGLSDDLLRNTNFNVSNHENQLRQETDEAVRNLIAADETQTWSLPTTEQTSDQQAVPQQADDTGHGGEAPKRNSEQQPAAETSTKRVRLDDAAASNDSPSAGGTLAHKKRHYRKLRSNRRSKKEEPSNDAAPVKQCGEKNVPSATLESLCDNLTSERRDVEGRNSAENGSGALDSRRSDEEASRGSAGEVAAVAGAPVSYTSDEIYVESEVVLSNGGTEITNGNGSHRGLGLLGMIAEHELDIMRRQLDTDDKEYDSKWYFPTDAHDVYSNDDVLE